MPNSLKRSFQFWGELIKRRIASPKKTIQRFFYEILTRRLVDFYLVTMPQGGTHWLWCMIARALVKHFGVDYKFESIYVPEIIPRFSVREKKKKENLPRIQHSHLPYFFFFKKKKVILLVRDLRDNLVSRYKKYKKRTKNSLPFSVFLKKGFNNKNGLRVHPLKKKVDFLNSWAKNKNKLRGFLIVKYEDLKEKPQETMGEVLDFLGISGVNLEEIIEFGSLENIRKLGGEGVAKGTVNKGQIGEWREYFSENDQSYFKDYLSENLIDSFGYKY